AILVLARYRTRAISLYQPSPQRSRYYIMYGGEGRIRTSEGVRRQIYSLIPLATREPLPRKLEPIADGRNRTDDLLITSQLLYQLSYIGRGLKTENYSQATTLSRTSQFGVLAELGHPASEIRPLRRKTRNDHPSEG